VDSASKIIRKEVGHWVGGNSEYILNIQREKKRKRQDGSGGGGRVACIIRNFHQVTQTHAQPKQEGLAFKKGTPRARGGYKSGVRL